MKKNQMQGVELGDILQCPICDQALLADQINFCDGQNCYDGWPW
jgi:hypothetical protein